MLNTQHPYASAIPGGFDYGRETGDEYSAQQQQYGHTSPMVSTVGAAPPAVSNVRARAGDVGVSQGGEYRQDEELHSNPNLFSCLPCCRG
jgi:casein kinase 1